ATAVGIGTALFYAPLVCNKINRSLLDYLQQHELDSIPSLTGSLILNDHSATPCYGS
ncbi:MAG: dihydroorotate dehydrogenase, partial [Halobacteria archaeon]|nr:dihydroorotate dehydrogenase [Halobacteria archaeon]